MHNRPVRFRSWGAAPIREPTGSAVRLGVLFGLFCLVVAAIGLRAAWLQTAGRDRFLSLWDRPTERIEPLPARNGRILTADGQVLAYDEAHYSVAVHYRWLEEPPDAAWLKSQALSGLESRDRRDRDQVAVAQAAILSRRGEMHRELAAALGVSAAELSQRFGAVQQRVERIVADVEARRREADAERETTPAPDLEEIGAAGGWRRWWELLRQELTTPPHRPQLDPLIVQEELQYHDVARDVPLQVVTRIQSYPARFCGVDVRTAPQRVYPHGDHAVHLLGVRTSLRDDEREKLRPANDPLNYRTGDALGRSGIELAYDAVLHGVSGERRVVTNRQGEVLRQDVLRPATDGRDVVLTIDSRLQAAAEQLLDAALAGNGPAAASGDAVAADGSPVATAVPRGACLVALDVRTGAILAAASAPRYDAGLLLGASASEWQAARDDPRRPFFPRVTQATLPPGSVFKALTAIAGLEAGVIDPQERFDCQGYLEQPDRDRCAVFRHFGVGHGPVTLDDALAQSCNVYFYEVGRRLGPEPIAVWAQRFGLGLSTGSELPGERAGHVPSPAQRRPEDEPWYPGTTRQLAVGQASLTVTPLQVARLMAAVANDGWLVTPHAVREAPPHRESAPASEGAPPIQLASLLDSSAARQYRPVRVAGLTLQTLAVVRRGLVAAVESPRGTGREAQLKGVRIAGKTGTAEIGGGRPDHAWFAGYAPADTPRVAFVVVLEEGGSGGRTAAPVAREFIRAWSQSTLGDARHSP